MAISTPFAPPASNRVTKVAVGALPLVLNTLVHGFVADATSTVDIKDRSGAAITGYPVVAGQLVPLDVQEITAAGVGITNIFIHQMGAY